MNNMIATLFAAALAIAVPASAQNLLVNGSFEAPVVAAGTFTDFPAGSTGITGWTAFGPPGSVVSIVSGSFAQNGVSFGAQDGAQWLDLTGNGSNATEGVSQTVATVPGRQYRLTFHVGNTSGGTVFGSTSTVEVLVDGALAFTAVNSTPSPTANSWQQFTHTFTAAGSATTVGFRNADPGSDNSNGIDNLALVDLGPIATAAPQPVPTLSQWALILLAGLLGVFAMGRMRRPGR